jgi:hypothetical protein
MSNNRLLSNMRGKAEIITEAINQCHRLKNGEHITLNGLYPMTISKGTATDEQLTSRMNALADERHGLYQRINRMTKNQRP